MVSERDVLNVCSKTRYHSFMNQMQRKLSFNGVIPQTCSLLQVNTAYVYNRNTLELNKEKEVNIPPQYKSKMNWSPSKILEVKDFYRNYNAMDGAVTAIVLGGFFAFFGQARSS